ncbi:cytochrome P450, partial [Cubamyces sp. BRFM 1775]
VMVGPPAGQLVTLYNYLSWAAWERQRTLMEHTTLQPLVWALVLSVVALLYRLRSEMKWRARMRGHTLPPGPRRLPFIGNMYSMPAWKPWIGFRDLAAQYGQDIMYLGGLGRHVLVLSKPDVIVAANGKPCARTGQQFNLGFMPYGSWWRRHRRAFWQQFHPGVVQNYWPVQRAVVHDFLAKALHKPTEARALVRYMFSATVMKIVYGVDLKDEKDERIDTIVSIFGAIREMSVLLQFVLEYLPVVGYIPKWAPGGSLVQTLRDAKLPNEHIVEVEFAEAKARVALNVGAQERGEDTLSVVAKLLARIPSTLPTEETAREEQVAKDVSAVAVEGQLLRPAGHDPLTDKSHHPVAGSDTVRHYTQGWIDDMRHSPDSLQSFSTIEAFLLAMVLYPEVQAKARAELDAIVGADRLPDYSDRDQLVYVNAILKESLRWHNTFPISLSHGTIQDDELRGFFIPAGTAVIPNIWACLHDPDTFAQPHEFDPSRFIRDGNLDLDVLDPASLVFGFGRRICAGRYFADSMLYMAIASVLHVFEIGPPLDDEGRPIKIRYEATDGFLSYVSSGLSVYFQTEIVEGDGLDTGFAGKSGCVRGAWLPGSGPDKALQPSSHHLESEVSFEVRGGKLPTDLKGSSVLGPDLAS